MVLEGKNPEQEYYNLQEEVLIIRMELLRLVDKLNKILTIGGRTSLNEN